MFHRPALDWRWHSWGQGAAAVAAGARALEALPADCLVGWVPSGTPASITIPLAIEASGRRSFPLDLGPGGELAVPPPILGMAGEGGLALARGPQDEAPPPVEARVLEMPEVPSTPGTAPSRRELSGRKAGDLASAGPRGAVAFHSQEALLKLYTEAFGFLEPATRRDVLLSPPSIGSSSFRTVLAASVLLRGALLLEPAETAWPAALRWARPTILAGSAERLRRGREALGTPRWRRSWLRRRRLRPPLDRLRAVVPLGELALPGPERSYWSSLGVQLPPPAPAPATPAGRPG